MASPTDSVLALLQSLVRIPSRAGEDDPAPVLRCIERWLADRGLQGERLEGPGGEPLGLYAQLQGGAGPGRWTVLDATLDTAGFGDPARWTHRPDGGEVEDGWLYGRGSADSKAAVAIFAHLLAELATQRERFAGRIGVLFDLDEHSGRFGGARAFFDRPRGGGPPPRPDTVIIGYPGLDRIVTGCRGFLRVRLAVHGVAAHSGASRSRGVNAALRAATLALALDRLPLPGPSAAFPLAPQLTITGIACGDGFAQVPDRAELRVDLRLTPAFDQRAARDALAAAVRDADAQWPAAAATDVDWIAGWPAYRLDDDDPAVRALRAAASDHLGVAVPTAIVGPSNIGNYLATLGVPAICGFGVRAEGIHASDERIALETIAPVLAIHRDALLALHRPD